ncbi:MAG: sigma-70 family RNA polymerase sigma factor [Solirubrobacterales bacterium]
MATTRVQIDRDVREGGHPRGGFVESFVELHGLTLLRAARRHSASASDADDAYQRTLETLLTKAPEGDDERVLAWALTVVKNEAMMEHRRSAKFADQSYEDYSETVSIAADETHERIEDAERFGQGREALARIKPDQVRCLLLRAEGMDYDEIIDQTGFSYAKVNRCLSEGRSAFRERVARLDSGAECRRFDGVLLQIADGIASGQPKADAELHLRNCLTCQSTLREYMQAPDRVAAFLPVGLAAVGSAGLWQRVVDACQSSYANLQERLFGHAASAQQGSEMALAKKAALVAGAAASLIAGGAVIEHNGGNDKPAPRTAAPAQNAVPKPLAAAAQKPNHRGADRSSRNPRDATTADAVGKKAGKPVDTGSSVDGPQAGGSIPGSSSNQSPASPPAESGSSTQSPDLAP